MWWLRKKRPRAGRKAQKVNGLKESMITSLRVAVSKKRSYRWRWWEILHQDHIKPSLLWSKEKEIKEWNEQKLPKVLPGYSGGRLQGRSTKETGKEEGEVNEDGGERRIRTHIGQEVVAGIKEKVSVHDGIKEAVQKTSGAKFHAKLGLLTNRK